MPLAAHYAGSFGVLTFRNAEQQNCGHSKRVSGGGFAHNFIRRKLEYAGHGGDGAAQLAPGAREQRQHQLCDA